MFGLDQKLLRAIAEGLKRNPDALLAFAAMALATGMLAVGVDPWFAFGLPVTIFVLYMVRMTLHERSAVRKEKVKIEQLEAKRARDNKQRAERVLRKVRGKEDGRS